MMPRSILFASLLFLSYGASAQFGHTQQYLDGNDTNPARSFMPEKEATANNLWQIGKPQKNIFSAAATEGSALVTDLSKPVPANNISRFTIPAKIDKINNTHILAIRWKQKLDMAKGSMGGIVEYSFDKGKTWKNIFNNPEVHNFYGYDSVANKGTLASTGETCFTGRDENWRDIWLCFNIHNMVTPPEEVLVRFTMRSDDVATAHEGWAIDNMMVHNTWVHTAATHGPRMPNMVSVYPTKTDGVVNVERMYQETEIKKVQLFNQDGKQVAEYNAPQQNMKVDLSSYPDGMYYVKVEADNHVKSFKVTLAK